MSRIKLVAPHQADAEQKILLDAVHSQLGMVPNFIQVLANSPAALKAFLGLFTLTREGSLAAPTRERIALALAQKNACEYCLSAHTALAEGAGLSGDEIAANRAGTSHDAHAAVAVKLARSLAEHHGDITTAELTEARQAGYSDADIVEIIAHVGMNVLTNILGKASRVDIDFAKVSLDA